MSRRSPMNNRYQKGSTPAGSTRKSAASAKPKRSQPRAKKPVAAKRTWRERWKNAGSGGSGGGGGGNRSYLRVMPDSPEYKALRKRWWIFLGIAIVLLAASFLTTQRFMLPVLGISEKLASNISLGLSWAALLFVGYSWWLDFKKIRPLIKDAQHKAKKEQEKGGN